MDSRLWHERLRGDLRRQGLPLSYIDRLVEELADHLVDSQTENPSMEAQQAYAQLGTTQQLAAAASHEFDRRSFAGRHPVLTFVVGPVVLAPALFVFCMLLVFGVAWAIGSAMELVASDALSQMPEQTKTHLEHGILWCYNLYARFLPFALVRLSHF